MNQNQEPKLRHEMCTFELSCAILQDTGLFSVTPNLNVDRPKTIQGWSRFQQAVAAAREAGHTAGVRDAQRVRPVVGANERVVDAATLQRLKDDAHRLSLHDIRFTNDQGVVEPRFAVLPRECNTFGRAFQLVDNKLGVWLGYSHATWEQAKNESFTWIEAQILRETAPKDQAHGAEPVQIGEAVAQSTPAAPVETPPRLDGRLWTARQVVRPSQVPSVEAERLDSIEQGLLLTCLGYDRGGNHMLDGRWNNAMVFEKITPAVSQALNNLLKRGLMDWYYGKPNGAPHDVAVYELTPMGIGQIEQHVLPALNAQRKAAACGV